MSTKIQSRFKFKIKTGYYVELLTPETVKLQGNTERRIVNNQYQHDSRALCAFVPSNSFGQLLYISPTNHIYSETLHSDFLTLRCGFF